MPDQTSPLQLLFDTTHAFDEPFTRFLVVAVLVILHVVLLGIGLQARRGGLTAEARAAMWQTYRSWLLLTLLLVIPVLLGPGPTILALGVLGILCYRDYARATGLFREKVVSLVVVLTLIAITFAILDNWYALCVALTPLSIGVLGAVTLLSDRPKGYVQRVALGVLGIILFGTCLGHAGYLANQSNYRPHVLWLLAITLSHPLMVYVTRRLRGPVLLPNTAPSLTLLSMLGTVLLTTALAAFLGAYALPEAPATHLLVLGFIVAIVSEFSDLILAAIRRDLGIPEPATGRLLDRVRGLILTAPIVYFYVEHYLQPHADRPVRIFTGG